MAYVIKKVLNSSVVLATDETNQEFILLGKGIGYGKKRGQEVMTEHITQVFTQQDKGQLEELLAGISPQVIYVATSIVELVKKQFPDIQSNLLVSLIDHIDFALKRLENGLIFENKLYYDVQVYYPEEFNLGVKARKLINEYFNINLPPAETASLAFHIADARNRSETSYDSMKISKITDEILHLFAIISGNKINRESLSYRRLLTHTKFFVERLITNAQLDGTDRIMYDHVLESYPKSTKIAIKILEYLDKQYHYKVTSEELMYLIIHIQRNTSKE
ncbi:PRD domain-containing protein [Ligilactobacillus equi]|uniref:PRD domain-containing protein n=1 Tax=Ligilactobacillus equi TaxID=137357 RepID=UPI002ED2810E